MPQPPAMSPYDAKPEDAAARAAGRADGAGPGEEDADTADARRRGVVEQREHIEGLTGVDPLRGGVAD